MRHCIINNSHEYGETFCPLGVQTERAVMSISVPLILKIHKHNSVLLLSLKTLKY